MASLIFKKKFAIGLSSEPKNNVYQWGVFNEGSHTPSSGPTYFNKIPRKIPGIAPL